MMKLTSEQAFTNSNEPVPFINTDVGLKGGIRYLHAFHIL